MGEQQSHLIDDLESTLAGGSGPQRAVLLRRITDLFLNADVHYTDEQVTLFDDVLARLLTDIEESAKLELSRRLAAAPVAPPKVARTLALDESGPVAAPLLIHAETLDDAALVQCARTRSQVHLLAISKRAVVPEPVTDVLVLRGTDMVLRSVTDNAGSKFSNAGFSTLVRRADGDDVLATRLGMRPDLPRHHFVRLLAKASATVRAQLEAARREPGADIGGVVTRIADAIADRTAAESKDYVEAAAAIDSLDRDGKLSEAEIGRFATAGRFEHVVAALSLKSDLPIAVVERVLLQKRPESLLFMARAIGLSWETTAGILTMRAGPAGVPEEQLRLAASSFERIKRSTAEQVLDFQRTRHAPA